MSIFKAQSIIIIINCSFLVQSMDYLLDSYLFAYLPFVVSSEWKQYISSTGMTAIKVADWFCKTQDIPKFYTNHLSFLAAEILYPTLCLMTLIHAYRHGGRYFYTWVGVTLYSLMAGILCYLNPNLDYQWHAQGLLTFFGGRIPLSVIFGVPQFFIYVPYIFIQRMHLPIWSQGLATGIGVLLLKFPYLIIGTKLLYWTWHTSDPVIEDRIYAIPWIILAFDLASTSIFVYTIQSSREILVAGFYDWKKFGREFTCSFVAAITSLLFGIIFATSIFCFAQIVNIPVSTTVITFISLNVIAAYIADRNNKNEEARTGNPYWFDELSLAVCIHFIFACLLILAANSMSVVSEGIHQPIGPCNMISKIQLPSKVLKKQNFLCLKTLKKEDFTFDCLPGRKHPVHTGEDIVEWYTICGQIPMNPEVHAEYVAVIWSLCLFAATILYQAAANSGKTPKIYRIVYKSISSKKNK